MTTILKLESGLPWRSKWKQAKFRDARFHVESGARESGQRIVSHEFPKRDTPYAESMGRTARSFSVRGYIVVYPHEDDGNTNNELQKKNYIPARDKLIKALESEGPAILQLPLLGILNVVCTRYRVVEDNKAGGFCLFDMTFTEYGQAPAEGTRQSAAGVYYAADALSKGTVERIEQKIKAIADGSPQAGVMA